MIGAIHASTNINFVNSANISHGVLAPTSDVDVPEPATLALLGVGLIGIAMVRRRTQRRARVTG